VRIFTLFGTLVNFESRGDGGHLRLPPSML
jgi:hypothetical protein